MVEQEHEVEGLEEQEVEETPDAGSGAEDEAKKYGWRPKEEFDLAPEGWVDAERFMEMPSTQVKVQRDEAKALKAQAEQDKTEFADRIARLEQANKTSMKLAMEQREAEHQRQLEEIAQRQRAAVELADTDAFDAAERQRREIKPPEPVEIDQPPTVVEQYGTDYPWLNDPAKVNIGHALIEANPQIRALQPSEQVKFVDERLKAMEGNPEPKPQKFSRTDPGGLGGGRTSKRVLPPEAMQAAKDFVEQGVFKSVEAYAAAYWENAK